jgi:hypothetical protein
VAIFRDLCGRLLLWRHYLPDRVNTAPGGGGDYHFGRHCFRMCAAQLGDTGSILYRAFAIWIFTTVGFGTRTAPSAVRSGSAVREVKGVGAWSWLLTSAYCYCSECIQLFISVSCVSWRDAIYRCRSITCPRNFLINVAVICGLLPWKCVITQSKLQYYTLNGVNIASLRSDSLCRCSLNSRP